MSLACARHDAPRDESRAFYQFRRPEDGNLPQSELSCPDAGAASFRRSPSRLGQDHRDGRLPESLRRLDPVGGQATDRIPTPLVPGRGGHGLCAAAMPARPSAASAGDATRSRRGCTNCSTAMRCLENFAARGRRRSEEKDPQLAADIRAIVEPHTYADPELKSARRYTNLSAAEVRDALIAEGLSRGEVAQRADDAGHPQPDELPPQADPEGQAAEEDRGDRRDLRQREGGAGAGPRTIPRRWRSPWTPRRRWPWAITPVGGKTRTSGDGEVAKGWDHDPPAKEKLVPFGILMVATRGVDARVRVARDQRRLGRCVADVVASRSRPGLGSHQAAGDLPGQRAEELGAADAVPEADGGVRRLVGPGDPLGVLSAVSQQVQPDRAVLVGAGEEVERGVAERPEGGPAMRPADEMEGPASDGEAAPWASTPTVSVSRPRR